MPSYFLEESLEEPPAGSLNIPASIFLEEPSPVFNIPASYFLEEPAVLSTFPFSLLFFSLYQIKENCWLIENSRIPTKNRASKDI